MTRASTVTLLSLDRFARIMGVNPVHFAGGHASVWPVSGACTSIWPQHPWQTEEEIISREELARAILDAENEIARVLGYSCGPLWIEGEEQPYTFPRLAHRHSYPVSVYTNMRHVIAPGRKVSTLVLADVAVTYSDLDNDSYNETATVTFATALTDIKELHVFFPGMSGREEWEIRYPRSFSLVNGTATFVFDSHMLTDPDLWERPTGTHDIINFDESDSFLTEVDIYRVYNDTTLPSVTFAYRSQCSWCGGSGCPSCVLDSADGCLQFKNLASGSATPVSATYNADTAQWAIQPHYGVLTRTNLWYYAGDISQDYLRGLTLDPLNDYWAHAIAWFATARLSRPFCNCSNLHQVAEDLRRDMTKRVTGVGYTIDLFGDLLRNPFGTRVGEYRAWQRVNNLSGGRALDAIPA